MIVLPKAKYAIVRNIPDSYNQCIKPDPSDKIFNADGAPVDVDLARRQHAAYCKALKEAGLTLIRLEADDQLPDSCFTEDPVSVFKKKVVVSFMQKGSRQAEIYRLEEELKKFKVKIFRIKPPGTLEGGDVVKVGSKVYVGVSNRTNISGTEQLQKFLAGDGLEVVNVPLENALHLGTVCQYLGERDGVSVIIAASGYFRFPSQFKKYRVIRVPADEAYAANCLAANDTIFMPAGYPKTRKMLINAGFEKIVEIEASEFRKAGGSLTCLSKLLSEEIEGAKQ